MNGINWRLIVMHLIAAFFFALAAKQFAILSDINFIAILDKLENKDELLNVAGENNNLMRIVSLTNWIVISVLIGLIVAFAISLAIALRRRTFWLNSLIVLLIGIVLNKLGTFDNKIIETIFYSIGRLAASFGLIYKFIINGVLLTTVGAFVFFSKWTNNIIFNSLQNKRNAIITR